MAKNQDVDPIAPWKLPYSSLLVQIVSTINRDRARRAVSVHVEMLFVWRETEYSRSFEVSVEQWEEHVVPMTLASGQR